MVEGNTFAIDPSKIPGCKPSKGCGFNGVLFRTTAPIHAGRRTTGKVVQKDITFEQNNVWRNNTYTGSWHFMVEGGRTRGHLGRVAICVHTHQDAGSSMN